MTQRSQRKDRWGKEGREAGEEPITLRKMCFCCLNMGLHCGSPTRQRTTNLGAPNPSILTPFFSQFPKLWTCSGCSIFHILPSVHPGILLSLGSGEDGWEILRDAHLDTWCRSSLSPESCRQERLLPEGWLWALVCTPIFNTTFHTHIGGREKRTESAPELYDLKSHF